MEIKYINHFIPFWNSTLFQLSLFHAIIPPSYPPFLPLQSFQSNLKSSLPSLPSISFSFTNDLKSLYPLTHPIISLNLQFSSFSSIQPFLTFYSSNIPLLIQPLS